MRRSGILMPITSLPSPYGIGTLGQCARDFICFLEKAGQTYWQILPIGPTGYGNSPYQPCSSYAGNPYMIDLEELSKEDLLSPNEYTSIFWGDNETLIDYDILYENRLKVLKTACRNARTQYPDAFLNFTKEQAYWLDDYALFMAIKSYYNGASQIEWPMDIRKREPEAMKHYTSLLQEDILFYKTVQFLFFRQWDRLREFAHSHHILLIGDIPIYMGIDSSDVWAHPEEFQLDEELLPIEVAGCPPDAFSADGQLWGNPLFNWDHMKETGFTWWIFRIQYQTQIYDLLRIDHFRGFDSYYAIPYSDDTARNGIWREGPGIALFDALKNELGTLPLIAEDLGILTPSVRTLLSDTGFPGMKVLQFAFNSSETDSAYLPHNHIKNCIVYTGTHDNDTILGWERSSSPGDISYAKDYLGYHENEGFNWCMIRAALSSVADTTILHMADLLNLGSEGRINTPSTIGNNWRWRCLPNDYDDALASRLYHLNALYGRLN